MTCKRLLHLIASTSLLYLFVPRGHAQVIPVASADVTSLGIEDLMKLEVTTVSKRGKRLAKTAAAVYVITQEDIRHSGAANIPDVLRLVPGVNVAQLDSHSWAISARGFNELYSSKMLVLIDGRNVYSPFFSGVYWDVQDVVMEDIDRIEVVRGPGATTWGANAINGVINIITRHSRQTQGLLVAAGAGVRDQDSASVRYGGMIGQNGSYRIYTKHSHGSPFVNNGGGDAGDQWDTTHGGFRADWESKKVGQLSIQGDFYGGNVGDTYQFPDLRPPFSRLVLSHAAVQGQSVQGEWERPLSSRLNLTVRGSFDRWSRDSGEKSPIRTGDVDAQLNYSLSDSNQLTWGAGYRESNATYTGTYSGNQTLNLSRRVTSWFLQDDLDVIPDRLTLSAGAKFEYDDKTGVHAQPSLHLVWSQSKKTEFWTAASRAVRTPSWAEQMLNAPLAAGPSPIGVPNLVVVTGDPNMKPEDLLAYEAGARYQASAALSFDVAGFYNVYRHLATVEPKTTVWNDARNPLYLITPSQFANSLDAESRGLELSVKWRPVPVWKLGGSYSFFSINGRHYADSRDLLQDTGFKNAPSQQFGVQSSVELTTKLEWNANWQYVGPLDYLRVPGYHRIDSHLTWRLAPSTELSAGVRNAANATSIQYQSIRDLGLTPEHDPGRRAYMSITVRF